MQALFIIRMLNHIICLPLFNIYNWLISQNPDFFSFRKIQFFFFISQNSDLQACDLVFRYENNPLECTLFLLSERSITSYVYLCLIFTIGSFRKIQIFLLICNKQYVAAIGSFRKIQIFFSFRKIQIL